MTPDKNGEDIVRTAGKLAEGRIKSLPITKLGTYDISILNLEDGLYEVKAVSGNSLLGGADFDNTIVDYCKEQFLQQHGIDLNSNPKAIRRLRSVCERAKRTLSTSTMADIEVDSLAEGKDFNLKLSRAKFESLCAPLFKKHIDLLDPALLDAKLSKSQIDQVILVGGTTRIPKLRQMISEYFGGKSLCTDINPDEAIAMGGAIQAAVLSGQKDEKIGKVLVIDVTPLSIGIETAGGIMTKIIERNAVVPCSKSKIFTTYEDNQPAVDIQIFEGERPSTRDCNRLGNFRVSNLPPARRGTLQIEVSMKMDDNSILEVTAVEKTSGQKGTIKITNDTNRLSKADVERMVKEAETYKAEDEKIIKRREWINKLESLVHQTRDSIESLNDKLSSSDRETMTNACDNTSKWLEAHQEASPDEYETQYKSFQEEVYRIIGKAQSSQADEPESAEQDGNKPSFNSADVD